MKFSQLLRAYKYMEGNFNKIKKHSSQMSVFLFSIPREVLESQAAA